MAAKALILLGLFAVLLVFSEVTTASGRKLGTVKPADEILKHDQQSYGGNGGPITHGGGEDDDCYYYGCCKNSQYGCLECCGEAVQTYQPGH